MNKVNQDNAPATQNIVKNRRQLVLWIGALAVGAVLVHRMALLWQRTPFR